MYQTSNDKTVLAKRALISALNDILKRQNEKAHHFCKLVKIDVIIYKKDVIINKSTPIYL
jgi:hypothetical protein